MRQNLSVVLFSCLMAVVCAAECHAAEIERVEPPFWWQGFEHTELQLQVYGEGIGAFDASIDHAGITVSRIERVESPKYVFVYLEIDEAAKPGEFDITFTNGDESLTHEYELLKKNDDPGHAKGFTPSDAIYLITPDRFVNGDPSNDTIEGMGDDLDREDHYGRHGGDIAGMQQSLDYIGDMGFTAIWVNPVLENEMPEASYHGYATTDFYAVDRRFGSNEAYRELVQAAKKKGIGFIMDMIVNHNGTGHWWMDDLPSADWINMSADDFTYTTHARTTNQDPYASQFDIDGFADGWFSDSMPDLNQRNPLHADYLIQNAIWWIEYLGLAGIRMDTYPYPDKHFMAEWTRRVMEEYPEFNIVGEEWSVNPVIVSYWQAGKENHDGYVSYLPSLMDFPVQAILKNVLTADEPNWGSAWTPLYELVGTDFLYPDPFNLVIFPDNHDMDRTFTQLDEDEDLFEMAMIYYATMRGIPQFYYGTEILMSNSSHPGSHGVIRTDFPGGWEGDDKNAFTGEGLSEAEKRAQEYTRKLLNWRRDATVVHDGQFMHYAPIANVYVYFRYLDDQAIMVVLSRDDEIVTLDTARFSERTEGYTHGTDVMTGKRFRVDRPLILEPRSALILELD